MCKQSNSKALVLPRNFALDGLLSQLVLLVALSPLIDSIATIKCLVAAFRTRILSSSFKSDCRKTFIKCISATESDICEVYCRFDTFEKKFAYREQMGEMGKTNIPSPADIPPAATVIVRSSVLLLLVKDLPCPLCRTCSLTIRVANCNLGMVSMLETYCTACEEVVNSNHLSDRVGAPHCTKVPITVTRSAMWATMDIGVGNAGLVKFRRYLGTPAMHRKTYTTHSKEITTVSRAVLC